MRGSVTLHKGDCLEVLDTLPANHFDAVVTDPTYHLASIVKRFDGKNAAPDLEGQDGEVATRYPANVLHDGSPQACAISPLEKPGGPSAARLFYCAKANKADRRGSEHPTVKPQALMQWLIRLVCPKGGLILDPFGGSGSTGWAASAEELTTPAPDALPGQQSLF